MNIIRPYIYKFFFLTAIFSVILLSGCSTTSAIPEGEQLFTGLRPIKYVDYEDNEHAASTQEEMEYVLASAPNGALFGSSYYRTPFPVRLWVWNAFSQSNGVFAKWMTKAFGSQPKLMSNVNPVLRAQVAEGQLKKFGYFKGKVSYENITLSNPKKGKVAYTVDMGPLWRLDSIDYVGFPGNTALLIDSTKSQSLIKRDDPFTVSGLESERQRITALFRNNGYYYYENGDASYVADTLEVPGKVQVKLVHADSVAPNSTRQYYIGNVTYNLRKSFMQETNNTLSRRHLHLNFRGRKPPIRVGVLMRDNELRPRQLYSASNEAKTKLNFQKTGLYSYTSVKLEPRDSSETCDTLDVTYDLIFDKPYDFYIEANAKGKTTGRIGPELVVGFTKRNAFKGAETFDFNMHGSYEWMTGHKAEGSSDGINSYEYGADASLSFPRIITPSTILYRRTGWGRGRGRNLRRLRYYGDASTMLKGSMNILNRAGYFKRHVISGELTYDWSTSPQSRHSFSPLIISYEFMNSRTASFDSLLADNPYLQISMRDQFVPKMSYTYKYTSPAGLLNPIAWEVTASEAGNLLSAAYAVFGEKWNQKNKTMFKNPFAQFVKLETDFVKTWRLSEKSSLVGHVNAGIIVSYGNAEQAPYYEQFYIGGANSVRAFNVRSIGPGKYVPSEGRFSYIDQTGDIKFLCNLEYRPRLFGDLYGALFLDMGNVWTTEEDSNRPGGRFNTEFMKQMAVGTGVGFRYDMGMFVIRIDWGIGLHVPYETGKSGFYNVTSFRDAQSFHLAVGYPF